MSAYPPAPHAPSFPNHPPAAFSGQPVEPQGAVAAEFSTRALAVEPGFFSALGVSFKVLPYALFRFAHWSLFSALSALILIASVGLGTVLAVTVHKWVGAGVMFAGIIPWVWFWLPWVERKTFGTKCGHIAVLTEHITKGELGQGNMSQFEYAKHVVQTRMGDLTTLWDVHRALNRSLRQLTDVLDFASDFVPIDVSAIKRVISRLLSGATRYLDAVILSYGLTRGHTNMAKSAVEGVVYCAQNGVKLFKTAVWVVVLEKVMVIPLWIGALTASLSGVFAGVYAAQGGELSALQTNATVAIKAAPVPFVIAVAAGFIIGGLISLLIVRTVKESFIEPVLLTMVIVRFHHMIRGQQIDPTWKQRLLEAGDGMGRLDRLCDDLQ